MILTTNRVATFDPAFHSRIHISLDYQELSTVSRRTIWENFLKANEPDHTIDKGQLTKLAGMNLNGRQIKNLLKTSRLLALHKKETLGYAHIATAFDITQHLHKETQATEHTRGSLYG
jgi:AAA+ superfamily predicted ATPase